MQIQKKEFCDIIKMKNKVKISALIVLVIFSVVSFVSALDFGGMYYKNILSDACIRTNPATTNCSCPIGYTSRQTWGFDTLDNSYPNDNKVYYCYRNHTEGVDGFYDFGGMFGESSILYKNPATNSKSCPSGYIQQQLTGQAGVDYNSYYCYKSYTGNSALDFGGMVADHWVGQPNLYTNPITGNLNCPQNYTKYLFLGTGNVDWNLYFCYKNLTNQGNGNQTNQTNQTIFNLTGITNVNSIIGVNWIYLNFTNPAQLLYNMLFLNNVNVANTTSNHYNLTGLLPNTTYNIRIHSLSTNSSINFSDFNLVLTTLANGTNQTNGNQTNGNQTNQTNQTNVSYVNSVSGLDEISKGKSWIYWTWTNPSANFSQAIVYIDGINVANTTNSYYNATGFLSNSTHTIVINTQSNLGYINQTNVSDSAITLADSSNNNGGSKSKSKTIVRETANPYNQTETVYRTSSAPTYINLTNVDESKSVSGLWIFWIILGVLILALIVLIILTLMR